MIIDTWDFAAKYFKKDILSLMTDFLKKTDVNSEDKKYILKGDDVFAMVSSYETRAMENAIIEAHKKYIDVQTLVSGKEVIGYFPLNSLKIKAEYDDSKDAAFYNVPAEKFGMNHLVPGVFQVFFPQDAHMPCLSASEKAEKVKKIVFKINVSIF